MISHGFGFHLLEGKYLDISIFMFLIIVLLRTYISTLQNGSMSKISDADLLHRHGADLYH